MGDSDTEPVAVPRQVHCELKTLRQMGTHELLSEEVLDGLETYNFGTARQWVIENPEAYVQAVYHGTRDETVADTPSE
ncbi:hypothetical protein [Haloprofundus salinisoli]|uniref:hypothetical protein n=1 Tax=Haloprofundus salinisoli TaxID=2876193 RepID=UPI001CCBCAC1|nr:hypothetical protein [Haloprofundus salinisoli]